MSRKIRELSWLESATPREDPAFNYPNGATSRVEHSLLVGTETEPRGHWKHPSCILRDHPSQRLRCLWRRNPLPHL